MILKQSGDLHPEFIQITDTHAHLDYPDYDSDRDQVIERAKQQGISQIVTIGIGRESISRSIQLCEKYSNVFAAIGVHPNALEDLHLDEWNFLEKAARHPRVVAIGETGLDYYRLPRENPENVKKRQHQYFLEQLRLAKELNKPVVIHCRDAYHDTLKILEEFGRFRPEPGVVHCFGADRRIAQRVFDLGYFISVGGIITFKNATELCDVVQSMPKDRLLLETDCPFLAPTPYRGKRNEPAHTRVVAEKVAEIWSLSLIEVSKIVAQNVQHLFGI